MRRARRSRSREIEARHPASRPACGRGRRRSRRGPSPRTSRARRSGARSPPRPFRHRSAGPACATATENRLGVEPTDSVATDRNTYRLGGTAGMVAAIQRVISERPATTSARATNGSATADARSVFIGFTSFRTPMLDEADLLRHPAPHHVRLRDLPHWSPDAPLLPSERCRSSAVTSSRCSSCSAH